MATTALTPAAAGYRSGLYEWVTTTDHKKIGILYIVNSFIFFLLAGLLALGVRAELAQPGFQLLTHQHHPITTFRQIHRLPNRLSCATRAGDDAAHRCPR